MSIGGVVAMSLTALLLEHLDWRTIFRLYSLVGFVWAAAFYLLFRTHPREHPWTNAAEVESIANEPAATSGEETPGLRGPPATRLPHNHPKIRRTSRMS